MPRQPLAEVFGFPVGNLSEEADRYRRNRLCPFNNKVPSCTKDRAEDPLGVCSIQSGTNIVITCPIRFRQDWLIADDAASFFFPPDSKWTSLTEVRINDKHGQSAGNIDLVLVSYDAEGHLRDFGALEVQAVYISGNARRPFDYYMQDPHSRHSMEWSGQIRPDYLSSSRKRLAPQLIYKGGILNGWGKKQAVAVDKSFFATLPTLPTVSREEADLAFFVYDLVLDSAQSRFRLQRSSIVYTLFQSALGRITTSESGLVETFIEQLQERLAAKLNGGHPPIAPTLLEQTEDE